MDEILTRIVSIKEAFQQNLQAIQTLKEFDDLKVSFLGKKSQLQALLAEMKNLTVDSRRVVGPALQELKAFIENTIEQTRQEFVEKKARSAIEKEQNFDVTAYKPGISFGKLHPYSQAVEEIEDIFLSMGYEILDGPEFESDFYNFTALNIPQDHPARDMYDTFWTNKKSMLMRTHTSPVQVRSMQTKQLPLAAIVPGRTYRHEAVDATHDFMFMQCEGFFVDKDVTVAHLFATAQTFLKQLFKKDELDIRIRPGFFPFVEPGFEIDMRCPFCTQGCSVCKRSTWMEVFPGGMIHPNVLKAGGIDPDVYSGFAFGFGLSRLVMLKYGIDDIRHLYGGKLRFLEQF
ncbi:phenylalanine--tRNA ligase subunit alpha [Candidatus Dependentiae bacterium]|nr:phenylalanine--tRNA ligase subunit alpha [Candidatus Dependentiae bacterium]